MKLMPLSFRRLGSLTVGPVSLQKAGNLTRQSAKTLTPLLWLARYAPLTLSDPYAIPASLSPSEPNAGCKVPTPPAQPARPERNGHAKGLALVVKTRPRCPNCGAANAVVFPRKFVGVAPPPKHPPLVCFACFASWVTT